MDLEFKIPPAAALWASAILAFECQFILLDTADLPDAIQPVLSQERTSTRVGT
jgi:hypothetical protein